MIAAFAVVAMIALALLAFVAVAAKADALAHAYRDDLGAVALSPEHDHAVQNAEAVHVEDFRV